MNAKTPSPAAGGGSAPAKFKRALPGLTADRLADLSCSLNQSGQEDVVSLVNRAIEVWNQSHLAVCGSDEERKRLLQTLNPFFGSDELISFETLAESGEVPRSNSKASMGSAKGVEKAALHYLETLREGCAQAFSGHRIPEEGVRQWKSRLKDLHQRCRTEKGHPLCALIKFQIYQKTLSAHKAHKPSADEIASVLDLMHELPPMFKIARKD